MHTVFDKSKPIPGGIPFGFQQARMSRCLAVISLASWRLKYEEREEKKDLK